MTATKSIRRTALRYGAVFSLVYFLLLFASHNLIVEQLYDESRRHRLSKEVNSFQTIIEKESPNKEELSRIVDRFQLLLEHAVIFELNDGTVVASSNLDPSKLPTVLNAPSGFLSIARESDNLLGMKKKLTLDDALLNSITILEMEAALAEQASRPHQTLLVASASLLIVLLILIGIITHLCLKPVIAIKQDLGRLLAGTHERLNSNVPEEFHSLITKFNNALELADRRLHRHRHFNSDLSHMVKTSISANLAILEDPDSQPPSLKEIDFMASNLRELSQSLSYRISKADISGRQMGQASNPIKVAQNVVGVIERVFPEKIFSLYSTLPLDFSWPIDQQDLSEMLGNLLENAGKWSTREVDISISKANAELVLEVADDGPGIPPDAVPKVTGRRFRLDEATTGFGLGLAIVTEIIDDYLGRIEIASSETGGAKILVTFPFPE